MKILLVEDSAEKADRVRSGLHDEVPEGGYELIVADDANAAKRALRADYFDLVILDIALPLRPGDEVRPEGGIELLEEILARTIYKRPGHVIGLTAKSDVYELAVDRFSTETWSLIYYDVTSDSWLERIARKVRHVLAAESSRVSTKPNQVDVAIIVAVGDELEQVKRNGWEWSSQDVPGDAALYYRAEFRRLDGSKGSAVLAKAPLMGMSAASVLATKLGYQFRPRTLVMTGICAGDSGEVQLGDLIAASPVWDYGSGKYVGDESNDTFEPAPYQIQISSRLRGLLERLDERHDLLEKVWNDFPGSKPSSRPRLHVGPFASGAAVVANKALFAKIQIQQHRKLIGLDMEAYGVMAASRELPMPQPDCLVLKGVSDFADVDKGDKVRHYAAYASARAMTALCELFDL